jgi:hypothetical protein
MANKFRDRYASSRYVFADMFVDIFVADMFCVEAPVTKNRGVERGCGLACC